MRSLFKKYPDFVIIGFAILLLTILAIYFFWPLQTIVVNLNKAVGFSQENNTNTGFDLEGAKALDLKGLIQK